MTRIVGEKVVQTSAPSIPVRLLKAAGAGRNGSYPLVEKVADYAALVTPAMVVEARAEARHRMKQAMAAFRRQEFEETERWLSDARESVREVKRLKDLMRQAAAARRP